MWIHHGQLLTMVGHQVQFITWFAFKELHVDQMGHLNRIEPGEP